MDQGLFNLGLQAVSTVGFPICVAVYALVKLNKTMERMTSVMTVIATKLDIDMPEAR